MKLATKSFYVAGGTLPRDAPSYVIRRADTELFEGLREGRFCYVLTSRQMGKSSLMVRTAGRLRQCGVTCAVLDLTAVGQDLTREQWYDGLQNALGRQLGLEGELDAFWLSHSRFSPLQRWMLALELVVLKRIEEPIVLFLDEIDAVRSLPFAADEFLAGIREFYNRRAECPAFERLTFCLLGVASPGDLIRDTRTTPFNIGLRIDLTDFTPEEAAPLASGLDPTTPPPYSLKTHSLLDRVLYWTGGHPYLTQRLCSALATTSGHGPYGPEQVDETCTRLLVSAQARILNDNLLFVRDRLLRSEVDVSRLLALYSQIHQGRFVRHDEADPLITVLRLSGITRSENGRLVVRNRIYARVFDQEWVMANMPDAEVRRQRTAYRTGVLRATALFGAVILALSVLGVSARLQAASARRATGKMEVALRQADTARRLALKEAQRARQAETKLAAALKKAEDRRGEAEAARRATTEKLRDSYLAQAQAIRWSGHIGQKVDSLAALEKAARYSASVDFRMKLRNEAIACMALPIDLRLLRTRRAEIHGSVTAIDENARQAASIDKAGNVSIWDLKAGRRLYGLPGLRAPAARAEFSRGGRFLALYEKSGPRVQFWDLLRRVCALTLGTGGIRNPILAPDDRSLFAISDDGAILRRNLFTGSQTRIGNGTGGSRARLRPSPDGRWLAHYTSRSKELRIIDLARDSSFSFEAKAGLIQVAWSPDSEKIAAATGDFGLVVWSISERRVVSQMGGHLSYPERLTFLRNGRLLAASGYDPTLRIWDAASGQEVLRIPIGGFAYRFSADSRRLYLAGNGSVQEFEVDPGLECRVFPHATGVGSQSVDFLNGSSLMVSGAEDGLRFWDVETGSQETWLPTGAYSRAHFAGSKPLMIWWDGAQNRLSCSQVRCDPERNSVRIDRPLASLRADTIIALRGSRDGRQLITVGDRGLALFHLPALIRSTVFQSHKDVSLISISPDRRWAASAGHDAMDVRIWDVRSGRFIK